MEIKIGVRNIARELTVDVAESAAQITAAFAAARADGGVWTILDTSGKQLVIPAEAVGFVEFGQAHSRPVGFGNPA